MCVKGGGGKEGEVKIQKDLNDRFSFWKVTNKAKKDPKIKEISNFKNLCAGRRQKKQVKFSGVRERI